MVAQTTSEADGYFSYMGLLPGKYMARIDNEKLKGKGMISDETSFSFMIVGKRDGSYLDNVAFKVRPVK